MTDFNRLNEFRYDLRNKETGRWSYSNQPCYGNIYQQIDKYRNNLKKMCLVGVSSETHEIMKVTSLGTGEVVYEK